MNKSYKVLFSRVRGVATAVSEIASSHQARKKITTVVAAMAMGMMAGQAMAEAHNLYGGTKSSGNPGENCGRWIKSYDESPFYVISNLTYQPDGALVITEIDKYVTYNYTKATASGNKFEVIGVAKDGQQADIPWTNVYGGYSSASDNVSENSVTMSGGTITDGICGGYTSSGSANSNKVSISGGTVKDSTASYGEILGGYVAGTNGGSANYNTVSISGTANITLNELSDEIPNICGGYTASLGATATASNNLVTISGGTITSVASFINRIYGGYAYNDGASDKVAASNNLVTISGGTFNTESGAISIYGGCAEMGEEGEASGNTVIISSMSGDGVTAVTGGSAYSYVDNNAVIWKSGKIWLFGDICGWKTA